MENQRKIVCFASGDSCHGCAHYHGKSEVCEHKKQLENQQTPEGKTLSDKISKVRNTKDYENLREILGDELGQLLYDVVNESEKINHQEANAKLVEALRELVDLKDRKDKHGKDFIYCDRQPKAWEAARELLQTYETK